MFVSRFIGAAVLLSGLASALPHNIRAEDSAINEPAVSAPDGTPITEGTPEATAAAAAAAAASATQQSPSSSTSSEVAQATVATSTDSSWETSSAWEASSTSSAWNSYQTPTYGSGSSSWGNSDYNDCVQQCVAKWGNAPQPYSPPPTTTYDNGSGGGSGVTHTVVVAPTMGVLRYIPFAVNASVGDTVKFMWGANNHTVTKSSTLELCNTTQDSPFASGIQVKDFVFTQVVNDTNPIFFHCAIPGHCQKGMFGIINPPNAAGSATSVSMMMSSWTSSNPNIASYAAATDMATKNNTLAARWGGNIDVANLPEWSHPMVAENVFYTRTFLASNPETMDDTGRVDLSSAEKTPLMIPQDLSLALNAGGSTTGPAATVASSAATAAVTSTAATDPSAIGAASSPSNGAGALASPKAFVAAVVAAATFFML